MNSPGAPEQGHEQSALPLLRLFCDYMAEWPLWLDCEGMVDAERLGLSDDLARRVAFWNEHFQQGFHHEHGWDTLEQERWDREEGVDLLHRLSRELDGRFQVQHEDWTSGT